MSIIALYLAPNPPLLLIAAGFAFFRAMISFIAAVPERKRRCRLL